MAKNSRVAAEMSRRDMFWATLLAGAAGMARPDAAGAAPLPVRGGGPQVYSTFGVKPFINCTSTYTINGGSAMLPEVIQAMSDASFYPVNLDELMQGAGKRIAELLEVEAAMVSSGAAGAMTCAVWDLWADAAVAARRPHSSTTMERRRFIA